MPSLAQNMAPDDIYEIQMTTIPQLTAEPLGIQNGEVISISTIEAGVIDEQISHGTSSSRSKLQVTATLLALFLSLFLAALDFSIATTATPTIINELHSATAYTWVGSAYLLASAAAMPVWGKLSDIWGRKIILLAAVATFFAGSAVCATSTSMTKLIVGRSIQGTGAGGMITLTNICISDLFSMRDRGFYLGLTGVVWSLASGVGPPIGGALTEYVSWRWNWWINLPACALSFLVLCFYLHVHNPRTNLFRGMQAIDWLGTVAILGTSVMILLGLDLGGIVSPWASPKIICLIVIGLFIGIFFILYETNFAKNPLMPMHILRTRSNIASLLVCFMHSFVNVSSWYFLPLYFQAVRGSSPLQSGLLILPITVVQSMLGLAAGSFISRTGRYLELIWVGMALTSLGFGLFITLTANTSLTKIVFLEIVAGLGVGLCFQPLLIAFQSLVSQNDMAAATALFGFVRSLSTAVSVVVGGVVFQNQMQIHYENLRFVLPSDISQLFSGNAAAANVQLIGNLTMVQSMVVRDAYAKSLSSMWIMYCSVAALGLIISGFISRETLSTQHVEAKTGLEKPDRVDSGLPQ